MSLGRILPLLVVGCASFPRAGEPERRPPDLVLAGAIEVGGATSPNAVTHDNYADCMVRCRTQYDRCRGMVDEFAAPALTPQSDGGRCASLAFPCWSDCRHRYLESH